MEISSEHHRLDEERVSFFQSYCIAKNIYVSIKRNIPARAVQSVQKNVAEMPVVHKMKQEESTVPSFQQGGFHGRQQFQERFRLIAISCFQIIAIQGNQVDITKTGKRLFA